MVPQKKMNGWYKINKDRMKVIKQCSTHILQATNLIVTNMRLKSH